MDPVVEEVDAARSMPSGRGEGDAVDLGRSPLPRPGTTTSSRSADFAGPNMGSSAGRICAVARLDLVADRKPGPATTRLDDQASLQAEGATRHLGDRQAHAIRLKDRDVDRSSRPLAASQTHHLSANRRREMTNELDRLLTIIDLSEMLGVPVDTLYGWRHRGEGPAGYRIGRHVRYRRAAVEAWLDTQADKRQR